MAKIEGIRIANCRVLKDLTLGKLWNTQQVQPLTPMSVVIGKNGVGKSSLFDAFGFLADCLKLGVEEACDARGRGGFNRIRSQGGDSALGAALLRRRLSPSFIRSYAHGPALASALWRGTASGQRLHPPLSGLRPA